MPGKNITQKTHKTMRITATSESDYEMYINVPVDADEDDLDAFVRSGNVDASQMKEDGYGSWNWGYPEEAGFDSAARDYSDEFSASVED